MSNFRIRSLIGGGVMLGVGVLGLGGAGYGGYEEMRQINTQLSQLKPNSIKVDFPCFQDGMANECSEEFRGLGKVTNPPTITMREDSLPDATVKSGAVVFPPHYKVEIKGVRFESEDLKDKKIGIMVGIGSLAAFSLVVGLLGGAILRDEL